MSDVAVSAPPSASFMRAPAGKRAWGIFALCLSAWTLTNVDQSLFSYALPGILQDFHLPLEAAGAVFAISFAASAVMVIFAGMVADRYGRVLTLCLLLAASACAVGLQGFAIGVITLTTARALGFGLSGGLAPITNALTVENTPSRLRGIAVGALQCGYPLGWLLASLFAAPLLRLYGWRATFLAAFAVVPLGLLGAFFYARGVDARLGAVSRTLTSDQAPPRPALRTLFAPGLRCQSLTCMAIFFMFGGAYAGSAFFFPTFFTQTRGYTPAAAASLVGLSNGIAVIGYLGAALVGEYLLRRRTVFALWTIGGAIALLGLLWAPSSHLSDMIWFSVMATLFYGAMAVLPVLVAEIFDQSIRATALGVCTSAPLGLGFAVFPLIVPLVVGHLGWQGGLTAVTVPLLVLGSLTTLSLPNRPSGLPLT
jgi:MFS family permease